MESSNSKRKRNKMAAKKILRKNVDCMKYIGLICILLLGIYPISSSAESGNVVLNPGFESGTTYWSFYTNGTGTFLTDVPGATSPSAAHINIVTPGTNVQLRQAGLVLLPNTLYRMSFKAYSNTGHDISISLMKDGPPNTKYGLSNYVVNLGTSWNDYYIQFTTSGFSGTVNDARLMFWLAPYDAAGDQYFFDDITLTYEPDTTLPNITFWYGKNQSFGQIGVPQQWVNILGNVQDASGFSSLNYSLNNGNVMNLSIGPQYRLESSGDFNVEINHTDLLCGDNQLVITAKDSQGNSKSENVSINYSCNNVWPKDYTINWSDSASIQDVAQISDGLWIKETNSIRPAMIGYDRLVTIGDMTWDDYEITVPITINTPLDSSPPIPPNFGIITRWQGHWDWNSTYPAEWKGKQPRPAWYPLGALGLYIWVPSINDYRLQIIGNDMKVIANDTTGKHLDVGVPYMFKMKAQTNGTKTHYSLKVWKQNMGESTAVTISGDGVTTVNGVAELKRGSATLNAHNANVSFGNVTIRSLSSEDPGPEIRDVSVEAYEYNATIRWNTDRQTSSNVSYGLSAAYENGSEVNGNMVYSHSMLLNGLQPGTRYHYKINSTDNGGRSTNTADLNFITKNLVAPNITTQPVNKTAINRSTATFSVVATGTNPLNYQWKKNGDNIITATGSSYTTPATNLSDSGTKYSVLVWNDHGSVTSNEVTLTVIEPNSGPLWHFRVPVTVDPAGFERYEKPVDVSMNFTQMLGVLGQAGTLDETSIRVIETDNSGLVLSDTVPFQFDKDPGFNAVTKASGTVVFIMNGTTPANVKRYYQVYFGLTGGSYSTQIVTPQVTIDTVTDEGQSSFRVAANGSTYYFQKQAGGFSSLVDSSGNDWISYSPIVGSAEFRGVPNVAAGGIFHPGFTCCTSSIVTQGPLKVRVRAVSPDGKWESLWDFYPGYATMTMVKAATSYFFLYEGTPGGVMEPDKDFMVRPDNTKTLLSESWTGDLAAQEWAYFSDPAVDKSLFAAHHEDDIIQDTYWPYKTNVLTVFGFGRTDNPAAGLLSSVPRHYTIGLLNGTGFSENAMKIYSAYKDLGISKGAIEQYDSVKAPIIVEQPVESTVVPGVPSTFSVSATGQVPLSYQWQKNGVNINGATNASYTTSPAIGSDNGSTYRVVVTNAKGSVTSSQAKLTVISPNLNQLVLLDVTHTHNTITRAFSPFPIPPGFPENLVSPVDYAHGTMYQRVQVITKPTNKAVQYQQCMFQDAIDAAKQVCTTASKLQFTGTGTYYSNQSMVSLFNYRGIQWDRHLLLQELLVKDGKGWPVDDRYGFLGTWIGSPDFSLYYPMEVRYTYIIVPPGGGEPVWPPDTPPRIITPPANKTSVIGDTATFSVVVSGMEPLYYQWQKNGVNIDGAHSSSYTIPPATPADNGSVFRVLVSNALGSITSSTATLTVTGALNIIQNPEFDQGTTSWTFYRYNVSGTFSKVSPGYQGNNASRIAVTTVGSKPAILIYQAGLPLEPGTHYRLSFAAYSTTGHDIDVKLVRSTSPYPTYGLNYSADLGNSWQLFTTEFDTTGFTGKVTNGRLQFSLVGFANGDNYYIDNIILEKVIAAPDTMPPSVIGNSPKGINVPYATQITVNFSEAMNKTSAESAFSIPGTTGSFSWNGNNMVYTPASLGYSTKYNVTIGTGAKDLAGNNLSSIFEWNFTTMEQDLASPTVSGNSPTGTGVLKTAQITVNFSEAMNQSSVRSAFSTNPVTTGTFAWTGNNMTYTPSNLAYNTTYNVTVGTGAVDLAGNNMASPFEWQFKTAAKTTNNLIKNPGFESGTTSWAKSTNGVMTFGVSTPGYDGSNYAGKVSFTSINTNLQIYQALTLEPNTRYRLSFAAYSTTGHDMVAKLILGVSPYSTIGSAYTANLNTSWQTYTTEFNNAGTVTSARLQFFFAGTGMAAAGDTYYIDNVVLEKVI